MSQAEGVPAARRGDGEVTFSIPDPSSIHGASDGEGHEGRGESELLPLPERKLTEFALRLAVLEKAATRLGKLAFIWATVVLLGGFAVTLDLRDFWFVTVILVMEGARVFTRTTEIEWQLQSTWTFNRARARERLFSFFTGRHGSTDNLPTPTTPASTCEPAAQMRPLQHPIDTFRLLPVTGRVFLLRNVSLFLAWMQVLSAISCVVLSIIRLVEQRFGPETLRTAAGGTALDLFYAVAFAEAVLFLMEKAYWTWKISFQQLFNKVNDEIKADVDTAPMLQRFLYDAYAKCIAGSFFGGLKMDLVGFALEFLGSESQPEQLIVAIKILQKYATERTFAAAAQQKIGTSTKAAERLVEMLGWKCPAEKDIRQCAADIVTELTGKKKNALRITGVANAVEAISSLLHAGRTASYDYGILNLYGLCILRNLSNEPSNLERISNAPGLLSRIIDFTGDGAVLRSEPTDSTVKKYRKALKIVKALVSADGNVGKMLRAAVSENVFVVSNLREILDNGEQHKQLQQLAIEVLTSLALDERGKEQIGSTGGLMQLLLGIFFAVEVPSAAAASSDASSVRRPFKLSDVAGDAVAKLTLESEANCAALLQLEDHWTMKLVGALDEDGQRRLYASMILRNLCAYSPANDQSVGKLRKITAHAMPRILEAVTTEKEKLLEVSLGLLGEMGARKFLTHAEFTAALGAAGDGFAVKLTDILKEYKYPAVKLSRIRRFVIQLATWMMEERSHRESFLKLGMKELLEGVAATTSEVENFHLFSGSVGIGKHRHPLSELVETAMAKLLSSNGSNAAKAPSRSSSSRR